MTPWTPSTHLRRLPYLGLQTLAVFSSAILAQAWSLPATANDGRAAAVIWSIWIAVAVLQTRWQWLRWRDAGLPMWFFWTATLVNGAFAFVGGMFANPGLNGVAWLAGVCIGLPCLFYPSNDREPRLVNTFQ